MNIFINNQTQEFPAGSSLQALLQQYLPAGQKGIAVAVNGQVMPRNEYSSCVLQEGDEILIIKATQGG